MVGGTKVQSSCLGLHGVNEGVIGDPELGAADKVVIILNIFHHYGIHDRLLSQKC